MSIKVNEITKIYGEQKALDNVTIEVRPGQITGLLGPNGAGKSTLMKILTCFIPPSSGSASVCGFDIAEQFMEVRQRVGYLPENNPLYPEMYVREFLEFFYGTRHLVLGTRKKLTQTANRETRTEKRISEIIALTGLSAEQHKKIGALSKGYRQRVGLAQALLHDPEVLILDEPTSGLDPNQLAEIRNLIISIGKEKTVILSTHIMQEVEAICERTIIIHKGKIAADDLTKNIRNLVSSGSLIRVEFRETVKQDDLSGIPGVTGVKQLTPNSYKLSSDTGIDIRPDVFKFAVDKGLTVLSLQKDEQKLEEVFQELTKN